MAGGKLSPRQKMVGMMYLVLTALLALNVSKDILEAFEVVNNGLEISIDAFEKKNQSVYAAFELAMNVDAQKAGPYYEKAHEAERLANDMIAYLAELKNEIVMTTEKIPQEVADTLQMGNFKGKDNYDVPTNLMIGDSQDGSAGHSRELKERLQAFKQSMLGLLSEEDRANANLGLDVEQEFESDGVTLNWEMNTFYHSPLSATVTILSQLEAEVRNAEFYVVNNLYKNINALSFPVDTIAAKVFAQSNYVTLGQEYTADIFLAAFNKTAQPKIILGDIDPETGKLISATDSVAVANGLGTYTFKPTREGVHDYSGVIRVVGPTGETIEKPFQTQYLVAKPNLVVSAEKMNVFYIGPDNPVSVSIPGVASEDLRVSISGGNRVVQSGNGRYQVKVNKNSPQEVYLNVTAEMPSGESQSLKSIVFRVKPMPPPNSRIAKVRGEGFMTKNELAAQLAVMAEYGDDFLFDSPISVSEFKMECRYRSESLSFDGDKNRLTEEMKRVIRQLPQGTQVNFTGIKAIDIGGTEHKLNPLIVRISG